MKNFIRYLRLYLPPVMYVLTISFTALLAVIVQYLLADYVFQRVPLIDELIYLLFIIWPIFWAERIIALLICPSHGRKPYALAFGIALFPPIRLAVRKCFAPEYIWLGNGWRLIDDALLEAMEKRFLYIIIGVSSFMLPFWGYEIFYPQVLLNDKLFYHFITLGNALVWGLFVVEFVIMLSLAPKPLKYLSKHWLELLIIALPMVALIKFLNLAPYAAMLKMAKHQKTLLLFINKFQHLLNMYRARTALNRVLHFLLVINLLKHWYLRRNKPEVYLQMLLEQKEEKQKELDKIEQEIKHVEALLAEREAKEK
jgi:voltage-gated potassium channel